MTVSNIVLIIIVVVLLAVIAWLVWRLAQTSRQHADSLPAPGDTPVADRAPARIREPSRTAAPPPASAGGSSGPGTTSRDRPAPRGAPPPATAGSRPVAPGGQTHPLERRRSSRPPPALAGDVPGATPGREARPRSGSKPPAASAGSAKSAKRSDDPEPAAASRGRAPASDASLASARRWGYQLQKLDIAKAASSPFDLLVIDYSRDGGDAGALRPKDLARLKQRPDGGRRIVLSYLSVGEAESYRYYWRPEWNTAPPAWLIGENPDWNENFYVRFWDPEWQHILFGGAGSYIDRIAAAGFDGLYLDRCDVYEEIAEHHRDVARERRDMEAAMVQFVSTLSGYVRASHPGLAIVMQNAEGLLDHRSVRDGIDGMAKEELLYGLDAVEKPNAQQDIKEARENLDRMTAMGKPVFVVEYLDKPALRFAATVQIREAGYVPYMARKDRELDTLETQQPDPAVA